MEGTLRCIQLMHKGCNGACIVTLLHSFPNHHFHTSNIKQLLPQFPTWVHN